jgi:hypothetical protein
LANTRGWILEIGYAPSPDQNGFLHRRFEATRFFPYLNLQTRRTTMLLTPTAIGAMLAGAAMWALFWTMLHKLNDLPWVRQWLTSNQCFAFINRHKGAALFLTEAINFGIHGLTSHVGVLFALSGTAINLLVICGYLPVRMAILSRGVRP